MEVYMKGIVLKIKSPKNFHNRKNNITYFIKRYGIFAMFLISILVGFILGIYFGVNTDLEFKSPLTFYFQLILQVEQVLIIWVCLVVILPLYLYFCGNIFTWILSMGQRTYTTCYYV